MSLTEIKSEIEKLSPAEKAQLKDALEADLAKVQNAADGSSILGCMVGTATLKPGWDEDEPIEIWEALRDDPSS